MAEKKKFETVGEFSGDDLDRLVAECKADIINGAKAVSEAIKDLVEKGNSYRISVVDKDGNTHGEVTATIGWLGLTIALLAAPVAAFLATIGGVIVGKATDMKLKVEKVVMPDDKPAEPAQGQPTA